jgi:hypothetical protein
LLACSVAGRAVAGRRLVGEQCNDEVKQDGEAETDQHGGDEGNPDQQGINPERAAQARAHAKQLAIVTVKAERLRHDFLPFSCGDQTTRLAAVGTEVAANIITVAVMATKAAALVLAKALKSKRFMVISFGKWWGKNWGQAMGRTETVVAANSIVVEVSVTAMAAATLVIGLK